MRAAKFLRVGFLRCKDNPIFKNDSPEENKSPHKSDVR